MKKDKSSQEKEELSPEAKQILEISTLSDVLEYEMRRSVYGAYEDCTQSYCSSNSFSSPDSERICQENCFAKMEHAFEILLKRRESREVGREKQVKFKSRDLPHDSGLLISQPKYLVKK